MLFPLGKSDETYSMQVLWQEMSSDFLEVRPSGPEDVAQQQPSKAEDSFSHPALGCGGCTVG